MLIWPLVGESETTLAGIQPYVPLGRIGMLTRYQTLPSEPICFPRARISWGRKSGSTLITGEFGFGVLRMGTLCTRKPPAAGNFDSIFVFAGGDFGVVVVVAVPVVVVPVEPATATAGSTTAAANPADATRTVATSAGRFTRLGRVAEL